MELLFEVIALIIVLCLAANSGAASLNPVLLVPGLSGSSLEVSTDGGEKWERIWASLHRALLMDKFLEDMSLIYDSASNTYSNMTDEDIIPIGFGTTDGVDYLDKIDGIGVVGTDYMEKMIAYFEDNGGYERNVNIRAAPYDWRMATNHEQMAYFWVEVQELIEEMYSDAGNMPVVIISHCYGVTSFAYWLGSMDQAWKEKFIKAFVPVAGPFTGCALALEGAVSGTNDGYEWFGWSPIPLLQMRAMLRTYGAIGALLPTQHWGNYILAMTPTKNYTVYDMTELLTDCGAIDTIEMYEDTRAAFEDFANPGVWVDCHVGIGTPTRATLYYPDGDFDEEAELWYVDGDGTVAETSASYCKRWQGTVPFNYTTWEGVGHIALMKDEGLCEHILYNVLLGEAPDI